MKRFISATLVVVLALSLMLTLSIGISATELKTAIGTVETRSGLRLREKASIVSDTICIAPYQDQVVIIRKVNDWYLVNYNLHIGYMHADYLSIDYRTDIDLGTGSLDPWLTNVRSSASTDSKVVKQVHGGDKVEILGFDNGWYKVTIDDASGYIRSDLVTLLEKPAKNKGTDVKQNSDASFGSAPSITVSRGQQIASFALNYVGCPYVYGGTSPSGFDCSGFVQYVFQQNGISINRTATAQLSNGYSVSYNDMKPGDIVYFGYGSTASHVGIYVGNGNFVHAQNSSTGVVITSLSESYYANRFLCAHRIVD
ncbi:MAG: NlpC/P60 family protein [Ruminococcaceae bacterium]|nr:NlpC/P60 family protein [Oscillospiraceae bacterium]